MRIVVSIQGLLFLWLSLTWTASGDDQQKPLQSEIVWDQLDDVITPQDSIACNASTSPLVLTDVSGWFTSPGYPNNYPLDTDCYWLIISQEPSVTVRLDFSELILERGFDYVDLYDGNSTDFRKITRLDGAWIPSPTAIKSSGSMLLVHFHSDQVGIDKGFNVTYTSTDLDLSPDPCYIVTRPLRLTDYNGTIQSNYFPYYYANSANCQWLIEAQVPNGTVKLEFLAFSTESGYDIVYVIDGNTTSDPVIDFVSGTRNDRLPGPYISTKSHMGIVFTSDVTVVSSGFQAAFTTIPPAKCGTILHEAPEGTLVGDGFDVICYLSTNDTQFTNYQCSELLINIEGVGNAQDLVSSGGNFGCLLSTRDDFVGSQTACYDNYQWQSKLRNCEACSKMIVCVRFGSK